MCVSETLETDIDAFSISLLVANTDRLIRCSMDTKHEDKMIKVRLDELQQKHTRLLMLQSILLEKSLQQIAARPFF